MDFTRLRLSGFKSFVDPTELIIENGLTGVVGPNGCGKSNLLEALRWVMGENSAKSMRGSGMDDVIFAGTATRPARNLAEVTLTIFNNDRSAPAIFNDEIQMEISRRIERESGSAYRLNARDVRAKDVQLLFADASTGAHSPSLVSQGRIGSLIEAKPRERRKILEEAAGISGLHSRRKEAESKLRSAEHNLERLGDIEIQLNDQIRGLKKQARQATRYKKISGEIRTLQALINYMEWLALQDHKQISDRELRAIILQVARVTTDLGRLNREQAIEAGKLPALREKEAALAAGLHRITVTRDGLDGEEVRLTETQAKLKALLEQIDQDEIRERDVITDSSSILQRLMTEKRELLDQVENQTGNLDELSEILKVKQTATLEAEWKLEEMTQKQARQSAERDNLTRNQTEAENRLALLTEQRTTIDERLSRLESNNLFTQALSNAENSLSAAENAINLMSLKSREAEENRQLFQQKEQDARGVLQSLQGKLARIQAEKEGLEELLSGGASDMNDDNGRQIIEQLSVTTGYETALGAALDTDLEALDDATAPIHWRRLSPYDPPQQMPDGVEIMADFVQGSDLLARRLSQIGVVADEAQALSLIDHLKPGQRLVSLSGGVWRWDGLCVSPDAPSTTAVRLAQKNRLLELAGEFAKSKQAVGAAREVLHQAQEELDGARQAARDARQSWREAEEKAALSRRSLTEAEKQATRHQSEESALKDRLGHLIEDIDQVTLRGQEIRQNLASLPEGEDLGLKIQIARQDVEDRRRELSEVRFDHDSFISRSDSRKSRLQQIESELSAWKLRIDNVEIHLNDLSSRRDQTQAELKTLESRPGEIVAERRELNRLIDQAEADRKAAALALLNCEDILAGKDREIREIQARLSDVREQKVRLETNLEQYAEQEAHLRRRILDEFDCQPNILRELAQIEQEQDMPDPELTLHRLERLKAERERLGAVNLRAEAELTEIQTQLDHSISERQELEQAITALRRAISDLNREGRSRILKAFDEVNEHFKHLFTTLFGGGEAHLELTESDDPLDAGLEIMASPPGKKMQNLGLLSGGEQALTALSLIFAVFMTNPSPICVLDEVDAPLDDANVGRFCDLLDEMSENTATRFMIVTHNAITMSRMNRLFGVTMAERGVSQLVSVDLESAERMRDRASETISA
ncbi:Chromosome partition protein smc [hydrothermal vent metagenome]|uniref:Chromosome partition protein smc n=1 Tax=hydrothermal vent metagenome TaxID=652676 RepID=A0A3B0TFA1_9ZZZZ